MDLTHLILWLIVGGVAGWLAGQIVKGYGFGVLGNIAIGIVGALVGGLLFGLLGIGPNNLIGSIVMATVGAVVLLLAIKRFNR